jgi:hypothetical protein
MVPCIRVRTPDMPAKKPSKKAAPKKEEQLDFNDEVKF